MENILDLPVSEKQKLSYAAFGYRYLALIIDVMIVMAFSLTLSSILPPEEDMTALRLICYFGADVVYFSAMESSPMQGTLGKILMRIRVGKADGSRISFANAIGRNVSRMLSRIFGIGYLMAAWDPRSQALHDKLAGTYVYKN